LIKSIVKKLKTGDGIEVHWVDASGDDGNFLNQKWRSILIKLS